MAPATATRPPSPWQCGTLVALLESPVVAIENDGWPVRQVEVYHPGEVLGYGPGRRRSVRQFETLIPPPPVVGRYERLRRGRAARPARLRIFEACGASVADLGDEHGYRVLRFRSKGDNVVLVPLPPVPGRRSRLALGGG